MRKSRTVAWVLGICALGSVITCSPFGGSDFTCSGDGSCSGGDHGVCEANGSCSFADPACGPMGQRYGDGPSAGTCVGTTTVPMDAPANPIIDAPATVIDAPVTVIDAPIPMPFCLGTFVHLCIPATPTAAVVLSGTIDTDASPLCRTDVTTMAGAPVATYCVLAGNAISGSVVAHGTRPLIVLSSADMVITAIDVASHRGGTVGPAANSALCAPAAAPAAGVGGGGGGGGFGGKGGKGGDGVVAGGTGGAVSQATTLRGGCPGAEGTTATTHGNGGGVVMLAAVGTITISGSINASGASSASAGATAGAGASGAGSGGMIVLEAVTLANNGSVFANGGGGAEGSGAGGNAGAPGNDPASIAAALGGANASGTGGDGGKGGAKPPTNGDGGDGGNGVPPQPPGTGKGGGGGGGGGVGVIATHGGTLGGNVSPTPTTF